MIVYRITSGAYQFDISGEGAMLAGGRWNPKGVRALYASQYISLSILEILVRADKFTLPDGYVLLSIELPEDAITKIELDSLKKNWDAHIEYTQYIGEQFLKENKSLVLKVPSAIVPQEHNFIFNPVHKDSKKIKVVSSELLQLDKRLLQT